MRTNADYGINTRRINLAISPLHPSNNANAFALFARSLASYSPDKRYEKKTKIRPFQGATSNTSVPNPRFHSRPIPLICITISISIVRPVFCVQFAMHINNRAQRCCSLPSLHSTMPGDRASLIQTLLSATGVPLHCRAQS